MYNIIQNADLTGKVVVIRTDINVPIAKNGEVSDDTRIVESFKTVKYALENGAKQIVIIAHFGRPNGQFEEEFSFKKIIPAIEKIYNNKIYLHSLESQSIPNEKIVLLENIRFFDGEEKNDENLSKKLAQIGDIYINDAFSASHRAHASISGIAKYTKVYAGLLLQSEIETIESILNNTEKEKICTIIGGSKVSTKFDLIKNLLNKSKYIAFGGGMANTFLYASGYNVGKSLYEEQFASACREILLKAQKLQTKIILPKFVVTAKKFENGADIEIKSVRNIENDDIIVDVFMHDEISEVVKNVDFVVWNGPLGAFETKPFFCGTETIARLIALETGRGYIKSIIGGGDVVSAINLAGVKNAMTYISTGGGAFLEWLEGKIFPGIDVCIAK